MCNKQHASNPSNCECECDRSCDVGEYLDYENCKWRKRLVDKLVDECTESVDEEVEIINSNKNKCNSSIVHIVLFSIFFTINVGIGVFFAYYKHVNCNKKIFPDMIMFIKQQFTKLIKWEKQNKYTIKIIDLKKT